MRKRFKKLGRLPGRPSALLKLALKDLEIVEKLDGYKIDMGAWHQPTNDGKCAVCMAGTVMANTLGVDKNQIASPGPLAGFSREETDALVAIDAFRIGGVKAGLMRMGIVNIDVVPEYGTLYVTEYQRSPAQFKEDMVALISVLKEAGL